MSLILEALKKSENQRRLGEAPSLGSPVMAVRRRRSRLPMLLGFIVVALSAGWWLRQAPQDAGTADVAATMPVADPGAAPHDAPSTPPRADAPLVTAMPPPQAVPPADAATRLPQSKVAPDATTGLAPDLREKVRSGELVVANPQLLKPGQPAVIKESEALTPGPATPLPPPAAAEAQRAAQAPAVAAPESKAAVPTLDARAPAEKHAAAEPPAAAVPQAAEGPATPLIWELPYAQRRDIPELKVTMHVYATEPAQRFAIINGERHVEGDDVGSLKLGEIRADGIVFVNNGQRFLLPRGGR